MKYGLAPALWLIASAFCSTAPCEPPARPAPEIELRAVKYSELIAAVKSLRGKVVVVDVWGDFCIPCKKEFPNLVRMHQQYASVGLACVSVTVDPLKSRAAALAFLKSQGAVFSNYLLDEPASVWQEKWDLKGVPAVFVFDRTGKLGRKFDSDDPDSQFTYEDVEKLIRELLAKK